MWRPQLTCPSWSRQNLQIALPLECVPYHAWSTYQIQVCFRRAGFKHHGSAQHKKKETKSPNQIHQSQSTPPLLVGTYSAAAGYDSWTFPASVPVASLPRRPPEPVWPPRRAWAQPSPPRLGCQSHCGPGRSAAKGHIQID